MVVRSPSLDHVGVAVTSDTGFFPHCRAGSSLMPTHLRSMLKAYRPEVLAHVKQGLSDSRRRYRMARIPAYGKTRLLERRCSGPFCKSTAHLGKPDPVERCTDTEPNPTPRRGRQTRCGPEESPTGK